MFKSPMGLPATWNDLMKLPRKTERCLMCDPVKRLFVMGAAETPNASHFGFHSGNGQDQKSTNLIGNQQVDRRLSQKPARNFTYRTYRHRNLRKSGCELFRARYLQNGDCRKMLVARQGGQVHSFPGPGGASIFHLFVDF